MEHHIKQGRKIMKQNAEVCYKTMNSSYDREATNIKFQHYGCLNKT